MKLSELAALTGARLEGDSADIEIEGAAGLDDAEPGRVTFLANPRYTPRVKTTEASAIYIGENVEIDRGGIAVLRAKDPYLAYTRALRLFHLEPVITPSIHSSAVIDPAARIAENVWIGACSVIGPRVEIGAGVRIYPNVTIYEEVTIGKDSVIHAGAVLRERSRAFRKVGEQLVPVEMKIANQRHRAAEGVEPLADHRHRRCGLGRVDGNAHQLGTGIGQRLDLRHGSGNVCGVRVGHRLNDDRGTTANRDTANERGSRPVTDDRSAGQ